jgi:exonuclease VII large subunit
MDNDELINKNDEEKLEPEQDQIDEPSQDAIQEHFEESENEIEQPMDSTTEEPSDLHIPPVIKEEPEEKKMPDWLRKGLIFTGAGILLLLIGYLISFFITTVPSQKAYQTVLQELNNKENELNNLHAQFDQVSNDLQDMQNNLDRIQQDYQTLENNHQQLIANSEFNQTLIDMKYEIGLARFALLNEDLLSARQAISLAREQFEKIRILLDADISSGIQDRLEDIQRIVRTDPEKALDELRTLSENLERIPLK